MPSLGLSVDDGSRFHFRVVSGAGWLLAGKFLEQSARFSKVLNESYYLALV